MTKYCGKEGKKGKRKVQGVPQSQTAALPRPQEEEETDKSKQAQTEGAFSPFLHNIFQNSFNFKSPSACSFVKCGCSVYCFVNSANLTCRGADISKYFRESLGLCDTESRLYKE